MAKFLHRIRLIEDIARRAMHLYDSPEKIERDAQTFWSQPITQENSQYWHLRNSEPFANHDAHWLKIGQRHVEMFLEFSKTDSSLSQMNSMVEWGCGGGSNVLAFQSHFKQIWAVDISQEALNECQIQLSRENRPCDFRPVLIDIAQPSEATNKIPSGIDLFTCFYVFELLPSKEYGATILKIAHQLLRVNGSCIIQIKYPTGLSNASRRWAYRRAIANMTSYGLQEFWKICEQCGFEPSYIKLLPNPIEVPDSNYAYFFLKKVG